MKNYHQQTNGKCGIVVHRIRWELVHNKSKWWIELGLRPATIFKTWLDSYVFKKKPDFGFLPLSCNAVMELRYWHWPDGDIPEAPRLSPSYLVGPHLARYNRQQTLAKAQPVVHRGHWQPPTPNYIQAWYTVGYSGPAFKEAAVYSV